MKNILLISASPKIKEPSISKKYLDMAMEFKDTDLNAKSLDVRQIFTKHQENDAFEQMSHADAMIFSFPLYYFCLPGLLISFLDKYYQYYKQNQLSKEQVKIYAIVNCGFPEPEINLEAVRVIESFSRHINADFRMGILIGGGPMMLSDQVMKAGFMKKTLRALNEAFAAISADISKDMQPAQKYFKINPGIPRWLYFFMGNRGWIADAKKNGLKKSDLYKKLYKH